MNNNFYHMKYFLCLILTLLTSQTFGQEQALPPCPFSPNCVNSQEKTTRKIYPLTYRGTQKEAIERLKSILLAIEGVTFSEETNDILHFEVKTKVGKFTDDVHFLFNAAEKKIHFRSASRVGWSDFWANKRRMKKIVKLWENMK